MGTDLDVRSEALKSPGISRGDTKAFMLIKTRRILLVDDEKSIREGLSAALHKICDFQGEIKAVGNGKEAITEIGHCFYDICFLDIMLPDLNGLDVMKKINETSPDTVIVIMSASFINEDMKRTIEEGASLFIEKPFDLSQVSVFVKKVLERKVFVDTNYL